MLGVPDERRVELGLSDIMFRQYGGIVHIFFLIMTVLHAADLKQCVGFMQINHHISHLT